jgi:lysophospholipase L1-like esterase
MEKRSKIIFGVAIGVVVITTIGLVWATKRRSGSGFGKSKIKNKNPKKILIAGDSQVAIQNEQGGKITYTYPNILKAELEPLGYEIDVVAIGGKTTDWIKENLQKKLAEKKYDRVYIHGGGNDVNNASIPLEKTISNFQTMVDSVNQAGADPFVVLGYKIEGESGKFGNYKIIPLTRYLNKQEDWIPYVEKRKELQKRLPNEVVNSRFVPVYDLNQNTQDGIHPNAEGHRIVASKIKESILA